MQNFKRKITYFREHHNGMTGSTSGFMKLEIRGEKVKIIINIQEPDGIPYDQAQLYLYHEAGDHLSGLHVDCIESIDGVLTYQNRTGWQDIFQTGRDLYTFDGIAVVYNDTHYYIGDFKDKDRSGYELVKKEKKPVVARMILEDEPPTDASAGDSATMQFVQVAGLDNMESERIPPKESETINNKNSEKENKSDSGKCKDCPYQKKGNESRGDGNAFEEMIENYPKLPMYGATELFDCVRIQPRDIGKLDMRNWKLGVNSFLSHGFYTYQYLLLGKMRYEDGTSQSVIGVPGVYSNREKYMANMFGFDQFVPVKQSNVKTGEFGYWITEIMPSL